MKRLTFSLLIIFLVANSIGYAALIEDFDFDSDTVGEIPDGWFVPCTPGGFLGVSITNLSLPQIHYAL